MENWCQKSRNSDAKLELSLRYLLLFSAASPHDLTMILVPRISQKIEIGEIGTYATGLRSLLNFSSNQQNWNGFPKTSFYPLEDLLALINALIDASLARVMVISSSSDYLTMHNDDEK
jgi:hypothetical protein